MSSQTLPICRRNGVYRPVPYLRAAISHRNIIAMGSAFVACKRSLERVSTGQCDTSSTVKSAGYSRKDDYERRKVICRVLSLARRIILLTRRTTITRCNHALSATVGIQT